MSVLLQLVSSKPVPEDLRKGLVNMASGQGGEHGEGESESASESAATDKPSDTESKPTPVKGNLWDQIDQLGTQAKEKSEGRASNRRPDGNDYAIDTLRRAHLWTGEQEQKQRQPG